MASAPSFPDVGVAPGNAAQRYRDQAIAFSYVPGSIANAWTGALPSMDERRDLASVLERGLIVAFRWNLLLAFSHSHDGTSCKGLLLGSGIPSLLCSRRGCLDELDCTSPTLYEGGGGYHLDFFDSSAVNHRNHASIRALRAFSSQISRLLAG